MSVARFPRDGQASFGRCAPSLRLRPFATSADRGWAPAPRGESERTKSRNLEWARARTTVFRRTVLARNPGCLVSSREDTSTGFPMIPGRRHFWRRLRAGLFGAPGDKTHEPVDPGRARGGRGADHEPGGALVAPSPGAPGGAPPQDADDVAKQAQALLKRALLRVPRRERHREQGHLRARPRPADRRQGRRPRRPRRRLLLKMVETGAMPLSGEKLKPEELAILQKWVEAGAPPFDARDGQAARVPLRGRDPAPTSSATSARSIRARRSSSATSASRTSTTPASPTPSSSATASASRSS